jgi:hypothetical protein
LATALGTVVVDDALDDPHALTRPAETTRAANPIELVRSKRPPLEEARPNRSRLSGPSTVERRPFPTNRSCALAPAEADLVRFIDHHPSFVMFTGVYKKT